MPRRALCRRGGRRRAPSRFSGARRSTLKKSRVLTGGSVSSISVQSAVLRRVWRLNNVLIVRREQIQMTYPKRIRQLIDCNDRRIALPLFQTTQILLAESGALSQGFLRQIFRCPDAGEVSADQPPHIHGPQTDGAQVIGLSTIICNQPLTGTCDIADRR